MSQSEIVTLAAIALPIVLPFIIALAFYGYQAILQRLPMNQRLIVSGFANTIVAAVEQMLPNEPGAQKKYTALQNMVKILGEHGMKAPAPLLEMAIEAAVYQMNQLDPHKGSTLTMRSVTSAGKANSVAAGPTQTPPQ